FPERVAFERLQRVRLIKMNYCVELIRQTGIEIVTLSLSLRQIDNANGSLQLRATQREGNLAAFAQRQEKVRRAYFMKRGFIAICQSRPHAFALRGSIPIRRRGNSAVISSEPDQHRFRSITLANQLAYLEFA